MWPSSSANICERATIFHPHMRYSLLLSPLPGKKKTCPKDPTWQISGKMLSRSTSSVPQDVASTGRNGRQEQQRFSHAVSSLKVARAHYPVSTSPPSLQALSGPPSLQAPAGSSGDTVFFPPSRGGSGAHAVSTPPCGGKDDDGGCWVLHLVLMESSFCWLVGLGC